MRSLFYLNKYLIKYKSKLLLGFLFVISSNVFSLFPAKFIGDSFRIIEEFIGNPELIIDNSGKQELFYIVLLIFFSVTAKGFFMFLMRQTIIVVSRKIEYDLKNEIYNHYQSLSMDFFKKNKTGDILNRISEDVTKVRMYLGPAILYSLNLICLLLFVIFRMFYISPELTFWVLLPLPVLSFLIYKISSAINKNSELVQIKLADLTNLTQQLISSIKIIKSFNSQKKSLNQFNLKSDIYVQNQIELIKVNSLFFPLMILLVGASSLLTIFFGKKLVVIGLIDIGTIAEFIIYVNMLTWPVTSVGWVTSIVQTAAASQKRINEFMSIQTNMKSGGVFKNKILGNIVFSEVSFEYEKYKALNKINFSIKKGEFLGVIGGVGSGKSTILQLICRFLDSKSGSIIIDNESIENYNINNLRKNISYVPQESFLFSDSIRNNLLFGNPKASEKDLKIILDVVCITKEVSKFKSGIDTFIGERGVTLSGGQKQRLNIARALLKDSNIILIDDALSNIDVENEKKILSNIYSYKNLKTVIIVSNRISTISSCDQIIVLDNGNLVQKGTHNELLNVNGYYKKIHDIQNKTI
ncbi:MAG: ABC transporter [Flavobacteriales bacterium]|nr:ABC transporter [Flavobacteriales bacterium]|tara:strand:- start:2349 stop:4094 length:1746 start_codon:yes stop_codon:yes gene_type:complete